MENKKPTSKVISNYRKRRQQNQAFIIWGGAALLALIGIILLVIWLSGPSKPLSSLFATDTPTPTLTYTPTITYTPTETPTITPTFTASPTATRNAPYEYTVQEGEYLATIIEKEGLGENGLALIQLLNNYTEDGVDFSLNPATLIVYPGQRIYLPYPGMDLPTATPIPPEFRGKIDYNVQSGDTLAGIASKFNSTEDAIAQENDLEDRNALFEGQLLVIPVNLVTPTATRPPTSTSLPGTFTVTAAGTPPATPSQTATP